jgi:GntR family transcriptional regulator
MTPTMSPKKVPRYRAIADELIHGIVAKRYPVGTALPAESELCSQLQASRHTVREALRILEERGLISRRQGSGSEVLTDTPPVRYRQSVDSIEDLLQYGEQSRLTLLATAEIQADAALAKRLGCAVGAACIELQSLRSERGERSERTERTGRTERTERAPRDGRNDRAAAAVWGRPFALTHIYMPPQAARRHDKLLQADSALPTMLQALDARTLGRIEQTFSAVPLDAATAKHLLDRKGAPSLRADRAYFDRKGSLILLAISWHRADLYRYSTVLRHEAA